MTTEPRSFDEATLNRFRDIVRRLQAEADAIRARPASSSERATLAACLSAALAEDAAEAIQRLLADIEPVA